MITLIKKYVGIGVLIVLVVLCAGISILYKNNKKLKDELSISIANEKAFIAENNGLKEKNIEFQFTVDQLEYFNDSLISKLNKVKKELKIKDKNLKQMQYLLSEAHKKDSVVFRDTIFRDPIIRVDTVIGDKWYQMKVGLRYPNTIITEPRFISEKYVIINYRKETVNPPKKCFIGRWFQRKHKVVEVNVVERNPYIENKQQRFIEIVK